MENLEAKSLEYETVEGFLADLKKEFGWEDNKTMKIAKLKKIKQENRTIEEFVQKFRRAAKKSGYKRKLLVEEFKWEINRITRRKLIEIERHSRSIEQ